VLIDRKVELDISPDARIVIANGASLMIGIWEPIALPGRCNVKIRMDGTGALIVNGRFLIGQGCRIHISNNAVVQMDSGGLVGDDRISCAERIQMGKNFVASWGVDILDSDGHPIFFDKNDPNPTAKSAPVIIGDDCWIGHDAIILKGVVINDGAIIGAGSVVTRDVPHHTIVAGNPIREIRENAYWKV
jgi:acetyltransferase-like isoleucine patch superfamily enzyme